MILIILCHSSTHGGFNLAEQALTFNKIFLQMITFGGELGVYCFILITGYFMINSTFKVKKFLKLIFEVLFYSIIIMALFYGFGLAEFDISLFIRSLLPITYSVYWFVTAYVVLYILSPFINKLLKNLSQKMHLALIGVLFILGPVSSSLFLGKLGITNIGLFILFYAIAAYIKLYPNACRSFFNAGRSNFIAAGVIYLMFILSVLVFDLIGLRIDIFAQNATHFIALNSPLILLCAVCLFLGFKNLKMPDSRVINQIALSVFGIYLIHDNIFIRSFLWIDLFDNASYLDSLYLIPYILGIVFLVFAGCVIIDQIRIFCLERPLFNWIDKFSAEHSEFLLSLKRKGMGFVSKYLL